MAIDIATALRAYSATPKADAGAGAPAAPVAASGGFGDVLSSTIEDAVKTTKAGEAAMNASAARSYSRLRPLARASSSIPEPNASSASMASLGYLAFPSAASPRTPSTTDETVPAITR